MYSYTFLHAILFFINMIMFINTVIWSHGNVCFFSQGLIWSTRHWMTHCVFVPSVVKFLIFLHYSTQFVYYELKESS